MKALEGYWGCSEGEAEALMTVALGAYQAAAVGVEVVVDAT